MIKAEKGELAISLAGIAVWLVIVLFRGHSAQWIALPLAAMAVASITGGRFFLPGFLLLLASVVSSAGAASCAVTGVYCVFCSERLRGRVFGWLALAAWTWANPFPEAVPLLGASALVAAFQRRWLRLGLAGAMSVQLMVFSALPFDPDPYPQASRFFLRDGHGWWKIPPVTLGTAGAVLAPPFPGGCTVQLQISCGGVRDSLPVVAVQSGHGTLLLPMGEHTVTLELSGTDSVFLLPVRNPQPFTHPVAHVYAEAFP